ncbi:MAG: hypothetical protein CYG61_09525 [Actinobacteria bacterium]|nr:MAG: hypothetical protein CYG61_09525 [Actinomycetota bacterium]
MLLVQAPQVRVAAVLPMALDPKEEVALLHEHYKDSFAHVLVREQRRDRLFVILVLMFALLTLQVQYPATVGDALGTVKVLGVDVTVKNLPLPALLDVTWLLTLLVGLKYCQTALAVERQYPYLHQLEEAIAGRLSNAELFCREGKAYLRAYPSVLNWAWFCYVVLFPLAVLAGTSLLMVTLWRDLDDYGGWHKLFCTVMAAALIVSFALYQVIPRLGRAVEWFRERGASEADH